MKLVKTLLALTVLTSASAIADVSVHVLDTNKGLPGQSIEVKFYEKVNQDWKLLDTQMTDQNGRIKQFNFGDSSYYRVVFNVKDFFDRQKVDSFYDEIPVDFKIDNKQAHYHIPLLLSPYAYSTYRGN
ncbi:hydroxyisourate hydrolase [Vibrio cholerae]|uniref:hydroxyisourate hydrolase n=2 Tax=Vibrio cholerae TaxID=666 RepID=UPI0002A227DC|nr:hydroxyisourate hydrolase [Vibrio cholerae]EGR0683674.1 hydroxyisourate hydrolase [Vibrio cholerae]EGR1090950.1 hydroxyisourate hydrolase [Vibrio cholerae]EGR1133807.1 hydroxyisourate hydrolase [Vibrio cholerae]EHK7541278.1 hydroxyisourate hydrolase [Vibrio cholerae]EJL6880477.1 hydroxyisourate hydrolase [Vibrio cholerae]